MSEWKDVAVQLWVLQTAWLVPVSAYLLMSHRAGSVTMKRHVFYMALSYIGLTLIDVYTVVCEGYPGLSAKGLGMLACFALGNYGLTLLLIEKIGGVNGNS